MEKLPDSIKKFLQENKVVSVCFVDDQHQPHCINCFYAFDEDDISLIFKSTYGTKHELLIKPNAPVAGTILPDQIQITSLKGIQFNGFVRSDFVLGGATFNGHYAKAFPMSLMLPGYFWIVKLSFIKYTDNTLGFGNKTLWNKDSGSGSQL